MEKYRQVYAILRYDAFQGPSTPIENLISVKRILLDEEKARAEVERLNGLNEEKGCRYFMQATRMSEM